MNYNNRETKLANGDPMLSFWDWYDEVRGGGISTREIERRAGVKKGLIGNAYRKRVPTDKICQAIAKGIDGVSIWEVRERAGLVKYPPVSGDERLGQIMSKWNDLSDQDKDEVLAFLLFRIRHARR